MHPFWIFLFTLALALLSEANATPPTAGLISRTADMAEQKQWAQLSAAIGDDADVSVAQPDGMTALHWAAYHNHDRAIERLLDAGAEVDVVNQYGVSPLSLACEYGNANAAVVLINAGADVESKRLGKETSLMLAARHGNVEIVGALIEHGADVDATETGQQTALIWAAAEGNVAALQTLIDAGAELDYQVPKSGFSALFYAARQGQTAAALQLLKAGVDVNAAIESTAKGDRKPRVGMSALMFAIESGHLELALQLVDAGADPNDQRSEFAPLHAISWVRKAELGDNPAGDPEPRISGNVHSLDFVRKLVNAGANVNLQLDKGESKGQRLNSKGATPFLLAARGGDLPLMELLLELGADPKLANADETNPLMAAAGVGVIAVGEEPGTPEEINLAIKMLNRLGNDVNAVDKNDETAMHGAALRNFPDAVDMLASLGADPKIWNHPNKRGWTPVDIARGKRPGSVKPSPPTVRALERAMQASIPEPQ